MTKSARLNELQMQRQRTAVGFIRGAQVDGKFAESLVDLFVSDPRVARRISIQSSPRIASARNLVVRQFLKSDAPWLLMLDTDMVFGPDLLERMHVIADEVECPVLSGLYFVGSQENQLVPAMGRYAKSLEHELVSFKAVYDYEPGEILDVDVVGAGCLLVHRSVLEALAAKWEGHTAYPFFAETELNLAEIGEDHTFCLRLRGLGIPVRVDTGLVVGHSKGWVFTEADYVRGTRRLEATG